MIYATADTEAIPSACEYLGLVTLVQIGDSYYICDRSSQSYCDGIGWCPMRNKEPGCFQKLRSDGTPRHY